MTESLLKVSFYKIVKLLTWIVILGYRLWKNLKKAELLVLYPWEEGMRLFNVTNQRMIWTRMKKRSKFSEVIKLI